jgi:hypothetical protein
MGSDGGLYHGGSLRHPPSFGADADEGDIAAAALHAEIDVRVAELETGRSTHALDVEPLRDAPVELLVYFDVVTGDHVAVWRILYRERPRDGTAH